MYLSWRVCCVLHFGDSGPFSHSFLRWCQFSSGDANTAHACTFLRSLPGARWCETRFVFWCGDMFRFESGRPKLHSQIDVSFGRRKSYVGSGWCWDMLWGIVGAFNSPMYFNVSRGWLENIKESMKSPKAAGGDMSRFLVVLFHPKSWTYHLLMPLIDIRSKFSSFSLISDSSEQVRPKWMHHLFSGWYVEKSRVANTSPHLDIFASKRLFNFSAPPAKTGEFASANNFFQFFLRRARII